MSTAWNPEQYLKFEAERGRPFADLLARLGDIQPAVVVDLGCGPGNTTAQLVKRWPKACVTGIDSSPEMIRRAKPFEVPGQLEFKLGDLRQWVPDEAVDVLLSSATLQWVPGHLELLPGFLASLAPGGIFAFQVPANFDQPSHTLLHELATSDRWRERLADAVAAEPDSCQPAEYIRAFLGAGAEADVWETTYFHLLQGRDPVLQWISGTGLRPVLNALDETPADKEEFLDAYAAIIRAAYPADADGRVIFPFRRIFGVGKSRSAMVKDVSRD
jgi:trans-aconitate 2-methyltransferase